MPARNDAISMLKADHEKVRGLLAQLEKSTTQGAKKREQLLQKIAEEVTIHTTIEEEIFYPSYRDAVRKKDDRKLYQEALEEHHVVDLVMPEIEETDPSSEVFSAKAKVLKEIIEHHAEEEEKEMFKRARKVFDTQELRELGERMEARKAELQGQGGGRSAGGGVAGGQEEEEGTRQASDEDEDELEAGAEDEDDDELEASDEDEMEEELEDEELEAEEEDDMEMDEDADEDVERGSGAGRGSSSGRRRSGGR